MLLHRLVVVQDRQVSRRRVAVSHGEEDRLVQCGEGIGVALQAVTISSGTALVWALLKNQ